jgi:hypothetical protein
VLFYCGGRFAVVLKSYVYLSLIILTRIITTILFFLSSHSFLWGQAKEIAIPKRIISYSGGDFFKSEEDESNQFKIKRLTIDTSFDDFYRFENRSQIIEVWRIDSNYFGQVINFTRAVGSNIKEKETKGKLIFNKVSLKSNLSKRIFSVGSKFKDIPDMDEIKGWSQGFDGETFSIVSATKSKYSIKAYWEPGSQSNGVQYKAEVAGCIDYLFNKLKLTGYYDSFFNGLPYGEYTDGFLYTIKSRHLQKMLKRKK